MAFGVYIHTPYCLQRCSYCDFATYELGRILPPQDYFRVVHEEIRQRARFFRPQVLKSIYFGGGTPSLVEASFLIDLIKSLSQNGFDIDHGTECTIEINPATVSEEKLKMYLDAGINRFSVGAQTFKDSLLKSVNREHNASDTLNTLALLRHYDLNFTFDILFGLPGQSLEDLEKDLEIAMQQGARHISPYCLTVPEGHPLSKVRPPEEVQLDMFELIHNKLLENGFYQYEISNYAQPGFESRHNQLYWQDEEYWGLGLSSHSYSKEGPFGLRFWNASNINEYVKQIQLGSMQSFTSPIQTPQSLQFERLEAHQFLTDFCHTSLRMQSGLEIAKLEFRYPTSVLKKLETIAQDLSKRGLLQLHQGRYSLTRQGQFVSNQIFEKFTFLADEI